MLVYGPSGERVARYDKIHLFRFTKGDESYDEARTIAPGSAVTTFVFAPQGGPRLTVGLSVCYDLRFPELYRAMPRPDLILVPAAFTATTGKAHWEILLRARAVENLAYVLAPAQGGLHENGRATYGHSMLIDPWGTVLANRPDGPGVVFGDIDPQLIACVPGVAAGPRAPNPLLSARPYNRASLAALADRTPMKPSDPALDRLAVAKQMLLDPYGLDEAKLQRSLASIFEHRADYADLYFQYTRSESYSLEEGIVKSGSFDIEQGVGVRAVIGDRTAFAYSDDISLDALAEAAVSARSIARHGAGKVKVAPKMSVRAQPRALWRARSGGVARRGREDPDAREGRAARACARQPGEAGDGQSRRANTTSCWSRAATACSRPTCARWCGCRST